MASAFGRCYWFTDVEDSRYNSSSTVQAYLEQGRPNMLFQIQIGCNSTIEPSYRVCTIQTDTTEFQNFQNHLVGGSNTRFISWSREATHAFYRGYRRFTLVTRPSYTIGVIFFFVRTTGTTDRHQCNTPWLIPCCYRDSMWRRMILHRCSEYYLYTSALRKCRGTVKAKKSKNLARNTDRAYNGLSSLLKFIST